MVENLLLPRLKELRQTVWDASNGTTDYDLNIQHDGAPGHKAEGIEEYLASLFLPVRGNWVRQPAKSPCTNMLDMAVFHAVSSIVARNDYQNKEQLHVALEQAFNKLPTGTLDMQWACKAILMRQFVDNRASMSLLRMWDCARAALGVGVLACGSMSTGTPPLPTPLHPKTNK